MGQDCVRKGKSMVFYAPGQDLRCTFMQCFCSQTYNFDNQKFSETSSDPSKVHTRQNSASDKFLSTAKFWQDHQNKLGLALDFGFQML